MKTIGIIRKLDSLGRIVIPKELLVSMGIQEGDPMAFYTDGNVIGMQVYNGTACVFCSNADQLHYFRGRLVCENCMRDARDETYGTAEPRKPARRVRRPQDSEVKLKALRELIAENPQLSQKEMARRLGMSQPRISQLVRQYKLKD